MPPPLALLLCAGVVYYLLRLEEKQSKGVSGALWVPAIWMIISASRPVASWFSGSEEDSGSIWNQITLLPMLLYGLWLLSRRRANWGNVIRENFWLSLFLIYMVVSLAWSDMPDTALKRWIREFEALVMALIVSTDPKPRLAIESVLRRTIYVLLPLSIVLIKYYPHIGVMFGRWSGGEMWVGVTLQKNGLGRLCFVAIFFILWTLVRRWQGKDKAVMKRQIYIELGLLALAVLLFKGPTLQAYSATSLVALIVGLMAWGGLSMVIKMRKYSLRIAVLVLLCAVIANGISTPWRKGKVVVAEGDTQGAMGTLGRDSSFTGRSEIWASLLPDVRRSPILGAGFGSFWTPAAKISHDIGEAHNGYLDVTLDLGFVGLAIVVIFFLSSCKKALDAIVIDPDWGSLVACYVVMTAMHNTAESSINSFTTHLSTLLVFLTVSFRAAIQRQPKEQVKTPEVNKPGQKLAENEGVFAMPSGAAE